LFDKLAPFILEHENRKYQWDWERWIDLKSFIVPPGIIKLKLNLKLKESIISKEIDFSNLKLTNLITLASNFKNEGAPDDPNSKYTKSIDKSALSVSIYIMEELILPKNPGDSATLSVLCSLLRKIGKPQEALEKTKNYSYPSAPLLTSRAAAMCDLELWKEAKHEVGRALAMIKNNSDKQEAFNVVIRIKEAAPYLYKNN